MMSDVGDNEQPTNPPEQPPVPSPPQPPDQPSGSPSGQVPGQPVPQPGWTPEQLRQFQEFLRFQQFQEFSRHQDQQSQQPPAGPDQPTPPSGLPAVRQPSTPAVTPDLHQQLAGVSQQLADLSASQQRVERVVNPPLWKKLLRSRPVRWVIGLVILAILAIWGVPALFHYYFGGSTTNSADQTPSKAAPPTLAGDHPFGAINHVAQAISAGNPEACANYFDAAGQRAFQAAVGAASCGDAITQLHAQVTSQGSYDIPQFSTEDLNLPQVPGPGQPQTVTISGCSVQYAGGPQLGTFTLRYSAQLEGWLVDGYTAPTQCQPSTTAPALPIPTG